MHDAGCSDPQYCSIIRGGGTPLLLRSAGTQEKLRIGHVKTATAFAILLNSGFQAGRRDAESRFIAGNPAGTGVNGAHDKEERLDR